ncbi:glycosyltransferase [Gramella sp. AN32]|uniref:Glycosyltransferase n=1 Tax=Christiangramia antarctica TaxID=2058158 RepID=A0ABW5X9J5_9FLAO|nr:glycosyltransferase [Gramella sp. AN32]MCM4156136.1 dolichol-phosphate mannosyltransferase [Gramella sp. AN32]
MTHTLTIIIPVYNEEGNILRVEKEVQKYIDIASIPVKALFVNDGSSDSSLKLIKEVVSKNSNFHYLSFNQNYGLSSAIKASFDHVRTSLVGYIDSDLQTSPMDFGLLLAEIEDHELVTGVRSNRKDSFKKNLTSKIANTIRRTFTDDGMDDTGCPLKIIKTEYAQRIPMFKGLHRFLPAMILLQKGRIKQVPIKHFPRTAGTPKFGLRNRLIKPLFDCFAYLWMKKSYINYQTSHPATSAGAVKSPVEENTEILPN